MHINHHFFPNLVEQSLNGRLIPACEILDKDFFIQSYTNKRNWILVLVNKREDSIYLQTENLSYKILFP